MTEPKQTWPISGKEGLTTLTLLPNPTPYFVPLEPGTPNLREKGLNEELLTVQKHPACRAPIFVHLIIIFINRVATTDIYVASKNAGAGSFAPLGARGMFKVWGLGSHS